MVVIADLMVVGVRLGLKLDNVIWVPRWWFWVKFSLNICDLIAGRGKTTDVSLWP